MLDAVYGKLRRAGVPAWVIEVVFFCMGFFGILLLATVAGKVGLIGAGFAVVAVAVVVIVILWAQILKALF